MFADYHRSVGILAALLCATAVGCGESSTSDSSQSETPANIGTAAEVLTARPVDTERGVVELTAATAKLDEDGIVNMEISYKFTSGAPVKVYLCQVTFPGTDSAALKPLESFELKKEGSFKTGIAVGDSPVTEYSIIFSEADSPDRGYHLISNTLTGKVELPPGRAAEAAPPAAEEPAPTP